MSAIYQYTYNPDIFYYKDFNIGYVPILKNAHMWATYFLNKNLNNSLKMRFPSNGFLRINEVYYKDNLFENTLFIVILRDPIDRWISGFTEYLMEPRNYALNINLTSPEIVTLIKDGVMFDEHTKMQSINLLGLNQLQTAFFICDSNLEKNMNFFFKEMFNIDMISIEQHNRHVDNPNKVDIYPFVKNLVKNDKSLQDKLKNYYQLDYMVIDELKSSNKFVYENIPEYLNKFKTNRGFND